jgi:glycine cleavage system transcriptional repressor
MGRLLATVVGLDRTGIVYSVSNVLLDHGCALSEVSQTTLLGQFAGLFSFSSPEGLDREVLASDLNAALETVGMTAWVTPIEGGPSGPPADSEPYVITLTGPDSPLLIPNVTAAIWSFGVNIDNLRSIALSPPDGGGVASGPVVLVLEITVPPFVSMNAFRQSLALAAEEVGTEISLQHRDIFEAIHRI